MKTKLDKNLFYEINEECNSISITSNFGFSAFIGFLISICVFIFIIPNYWFVLLFCAMSVSLYLYRSVIIINKNCDITINTYLHRIKIYYKVIYFEKRNIVELNLGLLGGGGDDGGGVNTLILSIVALKKSHVLARSSSYKKIRILIDLMENFGFKITDQIKNSKLREKF